MRLSLLGNVASGGAPDGTPSAFTPRRTIWFASFFSVVAVLDTVSASSARDFPQAIALAKASGYRETVLFEKRQRRTEILR